jgi:asparagine synthase (glutamine-hydrolysing)
MLGFAAEKSNRALNSFTIGFSDAEVVDERPYAKLAAERYGAEYHEMTISATEFADFLPKYAWHMEEPVCEPTAVALYYVSRLAKDFVKVLISGEGGDEAFGGYPNYRNMLWLERLKSLLGPLNGAFSSSLSLLNRTVQSDRLGRYAHLVGAPLDSYYYSRISGPSTFFNSHVQELYSKDFAHRANKEFSLSVVKRYLAHGARYGTLNRMLYVDTKTALPDDLLLKADKMTMANSVELRVPLLDHKLLEFAARLPESMKVRGLKTKYLAKRALNRRVPQQILNRKKVGFPVPYGSWLRHELRDFVSDILLDRETLARGYFERKGVENLIAGHLDSGRFPKEILSLVSLELWHRAFLGKKSTKATYPTLVAAGAVPEA